MTRPSANLASKRQGRLSSIDLIRVFSILAVITVHVTDSMVSNVGFLGGASWWIANVLNSSLRIGVPLFLSISGYLFLENPPKRITFSRIVQKTIVPLLAWGTIYLAWNHFWRGVTLTPAQIANLIFTGSFLHLYFMFIIIGVYLVFPLISRYFWSSSQDQLKRTIVLLFALGGILTLVKYGFSELVLFRNVFTIFIPYIGFFLFGGYIRRFHLIKNGLSKRKVSILLFLLVLSCVLSYLNRILLTNGVTYFWSSNESQYFGEHFSPNMTLISLLVFPILLFLSNKITAKLQKFSRIIEYLAKSSFGIYLLHIIIIDQVDHFGHMAIHLITSNLWSYLFQKIGIVYLITLCFVLVLNRTPIIKHSLGSN